MISDNFYIAEKVTDSVIAIRSKTGEIMYLVEGRTKAALIDTGLGVGNLRTFVENLTGKPVIVILTHGHLDHAMGAPLFDEVYMSEKDKKLYISHNPIAGRQGYIEACLGAGAGSWSSAEYVEPVQPHYKNLEDGMCFDLGDIHLDIYELPGHTAGTMTVLIREREILITGDACNGSTFLFDENSLSVEEYRENLAVLSQRTDGQYNRIFMMHHVMEASKDLLYNVIRVCDDIMECGTDDIPFPFMGGIYHIAKEVRENFVRVDGGEGNIIYNKQKIMK